MRRYALSRRADRDIEAIGRFTATRWGLGQTEAYLAGLDGAFGTLARFPNLGRRIDSIQPGCFRFEHASHSIFYRTTLDGILILRVMRNGIILVGVPGLAYNIFIGAIILGMMTLHSWLERRHQSGT